MSSSLGSTVCAIPKTFSEQELAFALAWEVHAPGLGGWSVTVDADEEGTDMILVDPPLVYGDGFVVRPGTFSGVVITSPLGTHQAQTLRDALLLICPLTRDTLAVVEALATHPEPVL